MSLLRPLAMTAALLAAGVSLPAAAQSQFELSAGPSWTRDNESTAAIAVAWMPTFRQMTNATLRWEIGAVHLRGRDNTRFDLSDDVTVGHVGMRYERTDNGLTLGFGVGAQSGHSDALSGDPQFISTAGWRWNRFSLLARHISNASIHQPNDGETMLVAAWRF